MTTWKYTITGDTPSKKNTKKFQRSSGRTYYSKKFLDWQEIALWELKTQERPDTPIDQTELVVIRFWRKYKHKADNTNLAEAPQDVLVKSGVLLDDNFEVCPYTVQQFMGYDKENPRCEIDIHTL